MIMQTHRLVAKQLYGMLTERDKPKLMYHTFVWANIKPDVLPEYKKISHYYPANEEYVFQLLEKACDPTLSRTKFSEISGVLIHFLCDYACTYHSNMKVNAEHSMRQHMTYEFLLHGYCLRKIKQTAINVVPLQTLEQAQWYILSIIKRVDLEGMIPDMKADFHAMLEISASILKFVLLHR